MSVSQYRRELDRKRKQHIDAEAKVGGYRTKESKKRAEADKARQEAGRSKNASTIRMKLKRADQRDKEAATAGNEANKWQKRASDYARQETDKQKQLTRAEASEAAATARRQKREAALAQRRDAAERAESEVRLARTEQAVGEVMTMLREPKPEKLRILLLGSTAEGDLRVGREQKRIRSAVESALHRDLIDLDVRPAATTEDLLDGITKFRPHVVHFSGHSNEDLIVFEREQDNHHRGHPVPAQAFVRAIAATDDPPLLVLLNACKSAAQIDQLVQEIVPLAIGMSDSIEDGDAIVYAAQFYAAVANGQSVRAAHASGQAALELAGLEGHDLPTLATSEGVDPSSAVLVKPAE